jgi:phosphoglycerate-specific signal transduction histidine kinase
MSDIENRIENSSNISYTKDSTKNEKYQNISSELIKLKNIIKGGQSTDYNKKNILEYILYPELISINEIKNKIYKLFNVKNNDELN